MYLHYFFIFLAALLLVGVMILFSVRKKRSIRKIFRMTEHEKLHLLNVLAAPCGFRYAADQNLFVSLPDAWQREFGYCTLYDRAAPAAQMVYDCEPIYFNYDGRTWLIELWKGQYGISSGAEIGVYYADRILAPSQYDSALFQAVSDSDMLLLGLRAGRDSLPLFRISGRQWWLGAFRMGLYSEPSELDLTAYLTFPSGEMAQSFLLAASEAESCRCCTCLQGRAVTIRFDRRKNSSPCEWHPRRCAISQWKNRTMLRIYTRLTAPFAYTPDRLLLLYFILPKTFQHLIRMHSIDKRNFSKIRNKAKKKGENHELL